MTLALHLRIVGTLLLVLAAINVFVIPKRFGWKDELPKLSLLTRQVFVVHCLFIVLILVLMGVLALGFTETLLDSTPLAKVVLAGLALFWLVRLFVQWFVYDWALWRGKPFYTVMHMVFTGLWLYASTVFGWAWWLQMRH